MGEAFTDSKVLKLREQTTVPPGIRPPVESVAHRILQETFKSFQTRPPKETDWAPVNPAPWKLLKHLPAAHEFRCVPQPNVGTEFQPYVDVWSALVAWGSLHGTQCSMAMRDRLRW